MNILMWNAELVGRWENAFGCFGASNSKVDRGPRGGQGQGKVGARREPVVDAPDADGLILLVQCACRT